MTVIQSPATSLNRSAKEVFEFLANANNHQQLMPSSVYNWSSTEDEARFTIQNMAKLELAFVERVPNTLIKILPKGEAPFKVELIWNVTENGAGCSVQLTINADLNPFIKMVAQGPLQNLANYQAEQLAKIFA